MSHLQRHMQTLEPWGTILVTADKWTECADVESSFIHLLCISLWRFKLLSKQGNLLF